MASSVVATFSDGLDEDFRRVDHLHGDGNLGTMLDYIGLGAVHMITGYDHLLFLLGWCSSSAMCATS